jgi:hypothetical protein
MELKPIIKKQHITDFTKLKKNIEY